MLRSSTAMIGMKTFHCQRIPVAHRTMGGKFMVVSHQTRRGCASEEVTLLLGGSRIGWSCECGPGHLKVFATGYGIIGRVSGHSVCFSSTIGAREWRSCGEGF